MAKRRRLEAPLKKVKEAMNNRKFPNLSAKKPANGGPKISAPGITELTRDASSIVKPRDFRCKVCNKSSINVNMPQACFKIFRSHFLKKTLKCQVH